MSVSIWSRGAPIGLPASTAYRAAQSPYSQANASSSAPSATSPSASGSVATVRGSSSSLADVALVASTSSCHVKWNSWLQFPVQYRDLDHASRFGITVWCVAHATAVHTDRKEQTTTTTTQPPHSPRSTATSEGGASNESTESPLPAHRCSCKAASSWSSQLGVHSRLFAVGGCSLPIFNKRGSRSTQSTRAHGR